MESKDSTRYMKDGKNELLRADDPQDSRLKKKKLCRIAGRTGQARESWVEFLMPS